MSSSQSKPSQFYLSSSGKIWLRRYRKEKSTRQFIKGKFRGITSYIALDNDRR
ncbi:MAG: hypothetical protein SWJ54_02180 [Cyanobacteriota bacterium]|nr:hypothetical protein [Cyanobacteriota bacterium]